MILLALAAAALAAPPPPRTIVLRPGLVITKSATITRKTYRLAAPASLDSALIVIRGSHIVVDLNGATLLGSSGDPDQAAGVAIRIDSGSDITIKNGTIHGYRVNILARGTRSLTLADLDLSRSWKPRLYSIVEHESLADWLSFHHNEKGEWLRFGAATYLDGVTGGEIRNVSAGQGMNGLMLTRTDSLFIHDNTFQFNSGLGLGMYRSSYNRILHNRLDFNVRGYSHGFYWRGQDSADLLIFEQSSNNTVAYNSATHGGDGLFLWAGQSTMDTGEGGANDNLFYGNDFSFAPANAMEATFSRNKFVANRAEGSDYGLWGGYSYSSAVVGNCFANDRIGVAIEHGQENEIHGNRFDRNTIGVRLWGDSIVPSDWGYPKHRDTQDRDSRVDWNFFSHDSVGVSVVDPRNVIVSNSFQASAISISYADTLAARATSNYVVAAVGTAPDDPCAWMLPLPERFAQLAPAVDSITRRVPFSELSRRDRSAMIITEWGPYDWRTPLLWPVDSTHSLPLRLAVLGLPGTWTVAARRGIAALSATKGRMGDTITVSPDPASRGDWRLTLDYQGAHFTYSMFEPIQDWTVDYYTWTDTAAKFPGEPVLRSHVPRLDVEWYRPKISALPLEKWSLNATTTVVLPPGEYTLRTISDDGVRAYIDGRRVIDDWKPHESAVDTAPLSGGRHVLHVEYYQVDGWTELRLDILRGTQHPGGSPGPH